MQNQDPTKNEALTAVMARFQRRVRSRMVASAALLAIGAWLLYVGFGESKPLLQTFGVVFILYAGIIQVRIFALKRFVRQARAEMERKQP